MCGLCEAIATGSNRVVRAGEVRFWSPGKFEVDSRFPNAFECAARSISGGSPDAIPEACGDPISSARHSRMHSAIDLFSNFVNRSETRNATEFPERTALHSAEVKVDFRGSVQRQRGGLPDRVRKDWRARENCFADFADEEPSQKKKKAGLSGRRCPDRGNRFSGHPARFGREEGMRFSGDRGGGGGGVGRSLFLAVSALIASFPSHSSCH